MADFGNFQITNKGIELESLAQAGTPINFTKFVLGDGTLDGPIAPMTNVINPIMNVPVVRCKVSDSNTNRKVTIGFDLLIEQVQTAFYMREIGLFAEDPNTHQDILVFYGNSGNTADYIPTSEGTTITEKLVDLELTVSSETEVTAIIDSSLVYTPKSEFGDLDNLTTQNKNTIVSAVNEINTNTNTLRQEMDDVTNRIYPIGSIYMNATEVDPTELFGGIWEKLEDKFLIGASRDYPNGVTGGNKTIQLTVDNLPSHTHQIGAHSHGLNSHTHTIGAHSHGLNSHTHTYSNAGTTTGAATGNTGSTVLTESQLPKITGKAIGVATYGSQATGKFTAVKEGNFTYDRSASPQGSNQWTTLTYSFGGGAGHTHTLNSHTHTISKSTANTGAAAGSTANSSAFNSGAATGNTANSLAFNSGSTGSGTSINIMPPYLPVFMWKRIA